MKYCISNELKHAFEQQHFVLLRGLLSEKKVQELHTHASRCLSQENFSERDLALSSEGIRKIVASKPMSSMAQELSGEKKLRYGIDWVWQGPIVPWSKGEEPVSLASMVCVRPAILGAIIALSDGALEEDVSNASEFVLPARAGDILFFNPDDAFIWQNLHATSVEQKYLLLLYVGEKAMYVMNPEDPYTHSLKNREYGFGDRLTQSTHPILAR